MKMIRRSLAAVAALALVVGFVAVDSVPASATLCSDGGSAEDVWIEVLGEFVVGAQRDGSAVCVAGLTTVEFATKEISDYGGQKKTGYGVRVHLPFGMDYIEVDLLVVTKSGSASPPIETTTLCAVNISGTCYLTVPVPTTSTLEDWALATADSTFVWPSCVRVNTTEPVGCTSYFDD